MKHSFYQPNLRRLLLLLAVVGLSALKARAGIIVDVLDSNVAVNGIGTVDVLVYSDSGDINIIAAQFGFEIFRSHGIGALFFSDQLDNEDSSPFLNPYLFAGGDVVPDYTLEPSLFVSTKLSGSVFHNSGFSVINADEKLLIRLDVRHELVSGADPAIGLDDVFEIRPVWKDVDDNDTFFFVNESDFDTLLPDQLASTSGTVRTFLGPTAVPEPGHMVLMLAGVAGAWLRKRRTRLSAATCSVKT